MPALSVEGRERGGGSGGVCAGQDRTGRQGQGARADGHAECPGPRPTAPRCAGNRAAQRSHSVDPRQAWEREEPGEEAGARLESGTRSGEGTEKNVGDGAAF